MNKSTPEKGIPDRPKIHRRFRLQWESVQQAYVLLYPEGMVKLNQSAAEIIKRCDGQHTLDDITSELEALFNIDNLRSQIEQMLYMAHQQGWIE